MTTTETRGLSRGELERYHAEGFCAPIRVFSTAEMGEARARLESFERAHPEAAGTLHQAPHLLFTWLHEMLFRPRLGDVLADVLGPDLLCLMSGFRRKEPGTGDYVAWHQDAYYLKYEPGWVTCLVAFTDCTVENGCLEIVPGSHQWPVLAHEETDDEANQLTRRQHISAPFDASAAVPMELAAGEVGIFHPIAVHRSGPNRSAGRRITWLLDIAPTCSRRLGSRDTATLIRGTDAYGHYDLLEAPADDFGPAARALHQRAIHTRVRESFEGSRHASRALSPPA